MAYDIDEYEYEELNKYREGLKSIVETVTHVSYCGFGSFSRKLERALDEKNDTIFFASKNMFDYIYDIERKDNTNRFPPRMLEYIRTHAQYSLNYEADEGGEYAEALNELIDACDDVKGQVSEKLDAYIQSIIDVEAAYVRASIDANERDKFDEACKDLEYHERQYRYRAGGDVLDKVNFSAFSTLNACEYVSYNDLDPGVDL